MVMAPLSDGVPTDYDDRPMDQSLNDISIEYSYKELTTATENWSKGNVVGNGSYGNVYRAVLDSGVVAIKSLPLPKEGGFEEEVRVLSRCRHPNLVILMGFSRCGTTRHLVYEFCEGGDVYKRLLKRTTEPFLWNHRLSISIDAAMGLCYLHSFKPEVFHRDIKSANILLDRSGTAKMADFGLACLDTIGHKAALDNYGSAGYRCNQASGTVGYACPQYIQSGIVTQGSEVYSFGMVLLELLTAQPPATAIDGDDPTQYRYLVHALDGNLENAIAKTDPSAKWPASVARILADAAMKCVPLSAEGRPCFRDIVKFLRSVRDANQGGEYSFQRPSNYQNTPSPPRPRRPGAANTPTPQSVHPQYFHSPAALGQKLHQAHAQAQAQGRGPPGAAGSRMSRMNSNASPLPTGNFGGLKLFSVSQLGAPQRFQQPRISPWSIATPMESMQEQRRASSSSDPCRHRKPLLFSLEVVYSDHVNVADMTKEFCWFRHENEEDESAEYTTLSMGRAKQTDLFKKLLEPDSLKCISREHFQIWVDVNDSEDGPQGQFLLTNFSTNGTMVRGELLTSLGSQTQLRHGDLITILRDMKWPLLQFRFDTKGTCLRQVPPEVQEPIFELRFEFSDCTLEAAERTISFPSHLVMGIRNSGDENSLGYISFQIGQQHQRELFQNCVSSLSLDAVPMTLFEICTPIREVVANTNSDTPESFTVRAEIDMIKRSVDSTVPDKTLCAKQFTRLYDGDQLIIDGSHKHALKASITFSLCPPRNGKGELYTMSRIC